MKLSSELFKFDSRNFVSLICAQYGLAFEIVFLFFNPPRFTSIEWNELRSVIPCQSYSYLTWSISVSTLVWLRRIHNLTCPPCRGKT